MYQPHLAPTVPVECLCPVTVTPFSHSESLIAALGPWKKGRERGPVPALDILWYPCPAPPTGSKPRWVQDLTEITSGSQCLAQGQT